MRSRACNASIAAYISGTGLDEHAYRWISQPDLLGAASSQPTTDSIMIFASLQPERFRQEVADGVPTAFRRLLTELGPDIAAGVERGRQIGRIRSWPGHVSQFRQAVGPGWALVGDAGYFKDPGSAHGITNAFRDAELLANAVVDNTLGEFEATRDRLSLPLIQALDAVIDHSWTLDELPKRHLAMSKAMTGEHKAFQAVLDERDRKVSPLLVAA